MVRMGDVDNGLAWIVASGVSLWNLILAGTIKCTGMLFVEFLMLYNDSLSVTSWIGAAFTLALFVFAPLSGFLRDNTSHNTSRVTVAVATCMAAAGIFATAWTQSAYQAIITFGLLTGTSAAIMDAPILSCLGVYFKKRRFLANSIAFSGSSVGGFVIPFIVSESITFYGVRGALMILAGIWLHVLILVSVMRPPTTQEITEPTKDNAEVKLANSESFPTDQTNTENKLLDQEINAFSDKDHYSRNSRENIRLGSVSHIATLHSDSLQKTGRCISDNQCCHGLKGYSQFLCAPGLPLLFITFTAVSLAYYCSFFLLPPFIVDHKMKKSLVSTVLVISGVSELFSRIIVGFVVDRYPDKKTILLSVSFSVTAVFGFTLSFMVSVPLLIIYSLVLGFFGGLFIPLEVPMLMKRVPESYMGSAAGLLPFCTGLGTTIGPPIISIIKEKSGTYNFGLVFLSSCFVLALFTLWLDWCIKKRRLNTMNE